MGLGGLMVAAGGALGAAGRYGISLLPWRGEFPLLNHDTLSAAYPGAYQSLLQIIHNTGERINHRMNARRADAR